MSSLKMHIAISKKIKEEFKQYIFIGSNFARHNKINNRESKINTF